MDHTHCYAAMSIPNAFIGIAILSCLMSVAVLGSLFRAQVPGIRHWCAASGLLAVMATLLLFRRSDIVVLGASALLLLASLLAIHGFRRFFHRPPSVIWEYGALCAILAGLVYWTYVRPDVSARGAMISGFLAYVRFAIAWVVQRYRPVGRPKYGYHFVAMASVLGALVHAVRCVVYGSGLAHETTFLEDTPLNVAFLGMAILTLPCLSVGMVMLAHDRLAERMERLATIDDLTGALGRRAFIARTESLFELAKVAKSKLSIAILDIDNFKGINDRYGHAAGDQALAHVALTILREIRQTDVLGRIGGEEFALLLPLTGKEEAARLTNRLRALVAASVARAPTGDVACTLSAGVDEFGDGDTVASVMARADTALYAAKANGRNCVMLAGSSQRADDIVSSFPA
ncbi:MULTISPECIES: GGDEF domain-containing protein [Paraburkholderia]|uniref:GGDEF domain-containing protein n=1 Tax=Paraburkholderia TaxID=1822464 RepID=UPI000369712E|nr:MULTISPECIES: GGDEF domain-containing protein [Paraburkholderia]MDH6152009.1 diguanylate cyclase (GGDEF)-like protein [Paraburkholderia sp. WSM4179]